MISLLMLGGFLILFLLGAPVVVAIATPSIIYILTHGIPIDLLAQRFHYALDSFPLIAVPVFIFAGNVMNYAGITHRLFTFTDAIVGRMPGGLAQVNIFANLIFAGMSGSALADIGGLGQVVIKAMREKGFSKAFSAAVTCAGATVGPIFPPSIPLVIFGVVTGTSIIKLLLAGIVPALIAVALMMLLTGYFGIKRNFPRREKMASIKEILTSLVPALPPLMAPIILIGGMLCGLFTATEAAAVCVAYMIFVGTVIHKELTVRNIIDATFVTIQQTAAICVIIGSASLFGWILTVEQAPLVFSQLMGGVIHSPYMLLIILNLILLLAGMFMDSTTATLLIIPILMPTLVKAGLDPVHIGIISIFNLMIGLITPPLGLSLFLAAQIGEVSVQEVLREVGWYFIPLIVTLLLITFFPALSLYIPYKFG